MSVFDLARPSLVRRLVLLAAGWSLAVLLATGLALTAFFRDASLSRFDQSLFEVIDGLHAGSTIEDDEVVAPALTDARALRVYSGRYWQIAEPTPEGTLRVLVRSRSLWDTDLPGPADGASRLQPGSAMTYDTVGPNREPLRAGARSARLPGRTAPVVFMAAEDRSPLDADARRFAVTTGLFLVLLGLGLVAAVFVQVRFGLGPLFRLRREVADVRKGKIERLERDYPVELEPLAGELNALLDHNQDVVDRQRTHVGNLAHALKTPLSVMLTEAGLHDHPLSEVVTRQARTMREQVDHHLRRARAAARSQGPGERTPVAEVLDELARALERIHGDKAIAVEWDAPDDLAFHGERQDLLEIAGNVMENACKWGRRRVRALAGPVGEARLRLVVEDDGPGLPQDRWAEVLKRGERLDETAPGSGLGLSIVDELARAYGGSVELGRSALGGLKAVIELPRVQR